MNPPIHQMAIENRRLIRHVLRLLLLWVIFIGLLMQSAAQAGEIVIDCSKMRGALRALQGVNSGPVTAGKKIDLSDRFREIGVPLVRLHDCHWPHADVVDIHTLFPDPAADPARPESYRFQATDDYIRSIVDVGAGIDFRLGESIEHTKRKYYVNPPADPDRWAAICAGVVRHYDAGWSGGFRQAVKYWEIWNEPENRPAMWTGDDRQFLALYVAASRAAKRAAPACRVGGPGFGYIGRLEGDRLEPTLFVRSFLARCRQDNAPLDFFSWHAYGNDPGELVRRTRAVRAFLNSQGFNQTESHLNEWSYLPDNDWTPMLSKDVGSRQRWFERQGGTEGAAFSAAVLLLLQDAPIDAANYYSADIQGFGMFDEHGAPKKVFYAFKAFQSLREATRISLAGDVAQGLTLAAGIGPGGGKVMILVSNFKPRPQPLSLTVKSLPWQSATRCVAKVLDAQHNLETTRQETLGRGDAALRSFEMSPFSVLLIELQPATPVTPLH